MEELLRKSLFYFNPTEWQKRLKIACSILYLLIGSIVFLNYRNVGISEIAKNLLEALVVVACIYLFYWHVGKWISLRRQVYSEKVLTQLMVQAKNQNLNIIKTVMVEQTRNPIKRLLVGKVSINGKVQNVIMNFYDSGDSPFEAYLIENPLKPIFTSILQRWILVPKKDFDALYSSKKPAA